MDELNYLANQIAQQIIKKGKNISGKKLTISLKFMKRNGFSNQIMQLCSPFSKARYKFHC